MNSPAYVNVKQRATGAILLSGARWCASFLCRLRGMMFRSRLRAGEALILVEARDSRSAAAIHMFFVPFPIAVVWIDNSGRVVDKVIARPWRPLYAPQAPACYVLETAPEFLGRVSIGDEVVFEPFPLPAGG